MENDLKETEAFLEVIKIPLRLACTTESGWPIVLSLWFVYRNGKLYCATQESARVVEYLKNDPRCGFEIAEDRPPYCGVRGQAKATIHKDIGVEILEKLLDRYLGNLENPLAQKLLSKADAEVAIELEPTQVYKWDFRQRMEGISPKAKAKRQKICP